MAFAIGIRPWRPAAQHRRSQQTLRRVARGIKASAASRDQWHPSTRVLHPERDNGDPYLSVVPPLYQTATFDMLSPTQAGPYDYTRSGNPTRSLLEDQIADLEGGISAFAFSSGMAALSVVCKLVKSGEGILAGDDLYGGSSRLLAQVIPSFGIPVFHVDTTDLKSASPCMSAFV